MTITLDNGKAFEATTVTQSLRNPDALLLRMADERPLSQVAADFEGVARIERTLEGGVTAVYTGYTRLTAIARDGSGVRLMLEGGGAR